MKRSLTVLAGTVATAATLTLATAPSAAADPRPTVTLPPGAPAILQENIDLGLVGWDEKGPWVFYLGNMPCRIHVLIPHEWTYPFGTSPCWF